MKDFKKKWLYSYIKEELEAFDKLSFLFDENMYDWYKQELIRLARERHRKEMYDREDRIDTFIGNLHTAKSIIKFVRVKGIIRYIYTINKGDFVRPIRHQTDKMQLYQLQRLLRLK